MSTGTPPTEFEFSPLSISPPGTLVTEKLAEKDSTMLEQQVGIQAKTAADPRKSSNVGRMSTGTPPTEFEFSPLSISPPGTLVTEKLAEKDSTMLEQQAGIQAKTAADPRKSSNVGRMSTGTPPTEFEFSPLSISPPGTLVTEKLAEKDSTMLEQQAGIQAKTAADPRKSSNAGPYVDGDTSNRVRVFSAADITPGDTCHRKAGQKGPHDA
jgi:general stress protein YciG